MLQPWQTMSISHAKSPNMMNFRHCDIDLHALAYNALCVHPWCLIACIQSAITYLWGSQISTWCRPIKDMIDSCSKSVSIYMLKSLFSMSRSVQISDIYYAWLARKFACINRFIKQMALLVLRCLQTVTMKFSCIALDASGSGLYQCESLPHCYRVYEHFAAELELDWWLDLAQDRFTL